MAPYPAWADAERPHNPPRRSLCARRPSTGPSASPSTRAGELRPRVAVPRRARPLLARGRTRRAALRLHGAEPGPLSLAVVLGLVLHRDRPLAVGSGPGARRARVAAGGVRGRLHRPRDLLGTAPEPGAPDPLQRRPPQRPDDADDPAAPAGLGMVAGGGRPAARASPRRAPRVASRAPGPRRRRPAVAHPARRVRAGRLAEIRPCVGPVRPGAARVPVAHPPQSPARVRRAAHRRRRAPRRVRGAHQRDVVAVAAGERRAVGHARADRPPVGRGHRPLPRRRPQPPDGAFARPGPLHLGHPRSPGASRPPGGDRPAPGRGDAALGSLPAGRTTAQRGARRSRAFRPRPLLGPAPLLARALVDERRVAGLAGAAPAGLRRRGGGHGGTAGRRRPARGPARVLPPAHRRGHGGHGLRLDGAWRWRWPSPSTDGFSAHGSGSAWPYRRVDTRSTGGARRGGGGRSGFGRS